MDIPRPDYKAVWGLAEDRRIIKLKDFIFIFSPQTVQCHFMRCMQPDDTYLLHSLFVLQCTALYFAPFVSVLSCFYYTPLVMFYHSVRTGDEDTVKGTLALILQVSGMVLEIFPLFLETRRAKHMFCIVFTLLR